MNIDYNKSQNSNCDLKNNMMIPKSIAFTILYNNTDVKGSIIDNCE